MNVDTVSLGEWGELNANIPAGAALIPRSPYGEASGGYLGMWIAWVCTFVALLLAYPVCRLLLRLTACDWVQFRAHTRNTVLLLFVLLYTPIQLALSHPFDCVKLEGEDESRLSVDASIECGGTLHIVLASVSAVLIAGTIVLAVMLARYVQIHIVRSSQVLHERYLRWKEAEYLHGLNQEWLTECFWVWSSFRRAHAHHHSVRMVLKALLVLDYIFMRDYIAVQADVAFIVLFIWAAWETVFMVYRCGSTQLLALSINWVLVVNAVGGSMRAHKMRTPLTVDSNFNIAMVCVNGACFVTTLVILIVCAASKRIHWPEPSPATSTARSKTSKQRRASGVRHNVRVSTAVAPSEAAVPGRVTSPLTIQLVEHRRTIDQELEWVSALTRARAEMSQAQFGIPELVDTTVLDATVTQLRRMWRDARDSGSIMAWSLVDAMDRLAALSERCRHKSYLPNPQLSELLPAMVRRLRRRSERLALVSPQIRRIFLKLMAFRSWIGDRVFERVAMGSSQGTDARYYFNPFMVTSEPPTLGALSVMTPSDLLRAMPSILKVRPTGHPKVTSAPSVQEEYDSRVKLMRAVQRRWAEVLLQYERGNHVQDAHLRPRMKDSTEVAAWYAAARQIDAIVRSTEEPLDLDTLQPPDAGAGDDASTSANATVSGGGQLGGASGVSHRRDTSYGNYPSSPTRVGASTSLFADGDGDEAKGVPS